MSTVRTRYVVCHECRLVRRPLDEYPEYEVVPFGTIHTSVTHEVFGSLEEYMEHFEPLRTVLPSEVPEVPEVSEDTIREMIDYAGESEAAYGPVPATSDHSGW